MGVPFEVAEIAERGITQLIYRNMEQSLTNNHKNTPLNTHTHMHTHTHTQPCTCTHSADSIYSMYCKSWLNTYGIVCVKCYKYNGTLSPTPPALAPFLVYNNDNIVTHQNICTQTNRIYPHTHLGPHSKDTPLSMH